VLARVDLVPRTPRFREDQFRDLFSTDAPASTPPQRAQPSPAPARENHDRAPAPRDTAAKRDSAASPGADTQLSRR